MEATFTIKDGFNVANRATLIKRQAEFMGEEGDVLLHLVNLLQRYGLKDPQSLESARRMGDISNKAVTEKGQQELEQGKDYQGEMFFSQYDPRILQAGYNSFQRLDMLIEAYAKALNDKNVNSADLRQYASQVFTSELAPLLFKAAKDAMGDPKTGKNIYVKKRDEEGKRSKEEGPNLDASERIFDVEQDQKTVKNQIALGANTVTAPWLVPIMTLWTDMMNKHHEGLSTAEGYGALGLEVFKYGDLIYKFTEAVKALNQKDDANGDVLHRDNPNIPPSPMPQGAIAYKKEPSRQDRILPEMPPVPIPQPSGTDPLPPTEHIKKLEAKTFKWYQVPEIFFKFYMLNLTKKRRHIESNF